MGVVGCGLMGKELASAAARWLHLPGQQVRPRITAACDPVPAALEWFTANCGPLAVATADPAEVFRSKDVDAVYLAVPHDRHADLAVAAIEAGKALLAEKPFGIDLAAAERITAAMKANPSVFVRVSSEFPFFPGCQRVICMVREGGIGRIIEVEGSFLHGSDLDPTKPINWKRRVATCGEYGVMGDLGLHVLHVPLRFGWKPASVHAVLSKIVMKRPDGKGGLAECETWDNARLTCRVPHADGEFPMVLRMERIAPGETNSWSIEIRGTKGSARFSTKHPKTFSFMSYQEGKEQSWQTVDTGQASVFPTVTGGIFEFGFSDAILQMWAGFLNEQAGLPVSFGCVTPDEALASHRLFTAALRSQKDRTEVRLSN